MKKQVFRIGQNDTIKAHLTKNGKLIATVYDSGFTSIRQVKDALNRKVSDYDKGKGDLYYSILNEDKQTHWSN